jgi:hypothetical protein
MSHYLDMKTTITDAEALARALVRKGIDRNAIEIHDKAVTLIGYNGETRKANVIVRKQWIQDHQKKCGMSGYGMERGTAACYADMGFVKEADGSYKAMVDNHNFTPDWVNEMTMYYNNEKSKIELDALKIKYTESTDNGSLVIKAIIPQKTQNRIINRSTVSFSS